MGAVIRNPLISSSSSLVAAATICAQFPVWKLDNNGGGTGLFAETGICLRGKCV